MRTYTQDLRERIVASRQDGHSAEEVAKIFRVSKRTVERYWSKFQQTGAVAAKQRGGYRRSRLEKHDATLRRWIHEEKGLTLAQLQARIAQELGIQLGTTALWHRLERLGLSYKKNAVRRRAKPAGPPGRPPKVASSPKTMVGPKASLSR